MSTTRRDDRPTAAVPGSALYWEERYRSGGTSGAGSSGRLALFKAAVLNEFTAQNRVVSVVEFGCGDGGQLALADYPEYTGLDVSRRSIQLCRRRFADDPGKSFFLYDPYCFQDRRGAFAADLALSLDVVYHLLEDEVFELYMRHLFGSARRFVGVYSSNFQADPGGGARHVRHRRFTDWVAANLPGWRMAGTVPNLYPYDPARPEDTSHANFYFFCADGGGEARQ
jgi:hypothetical protein